MFGHIAHILLHGELSRDMGLEIHVYKMSGKIKPIFDCFNIRQIKYLTLLSLNWAEENVFFYFFK